MLDSVAVSRCITWSNKCKFTFLLKIFVWYEKKFKVGKPIFYHGLHEMWNVAGGPQNI